MKDKQEKQEKELVGSALGGAMAMVAGVVIATASPVFAGTAVIESGGDQMTYEYSKNALRMGTPGSDNYFLIRDDNMYSVSYEGGQPMVIDAGSMMKALGPALKQYASSEMTAELVSMKKTGKKETIAGLRGDVYTVTVRNESGENETHEVVLSTDKRAREFTDAMFLMTSLSATLGGEQAESQMNDIKSRLDRLNSGFLRFGDDMVLASIDGKTVPAERFELPAEPMDLGGLGAMLGNMGAAQGMSGDAAGSGNAEAAQQSDIFSSMMGAVGEKADRQADRVGGSVENEIDRETDEAVDKTINKAFKKLFGGGD
ncbi:MAG: hypothetical protein AAGI88_12765 [Pseudomonadota bacterium]